MEYIWNMYGIYMEYIWNIYIYGIYIYGIYIYMEYVWNIYGIICNMYGIYIYMEYMMDIPSGNLPHSYWTWHIEIVDLPFFKMVIFHFATRYQRGTMLSWLNVAPCEERGRWERRSSSGAWRHAPSTGHHFKEVNHLQTGYFPWPCSICKRVNKNKQTIPLNHIRPHIFP